MSRSCTAPALIIDIELQLRGKLAAALQAEAVRRKRDPAELLSDIIEAVLTDNLVNAVLE